MGTYIKAKRIIVNADDFGRNEAVTREIETMIEKHCISSTTVMANGTCLDEAASFARKHPEISFGAHICLSEFDSITKPDVFKKYGLTDEAGRFIKMAIFKIGNHAPELLAAIKAEIEAQIDILRDYQIPLSHCDSHHHVHTLYWLHRLYGETVKEKRITKVRIARHFERRNLFRDPAAWLKPWLKRELVINYYKSHFETTKQFCSYAEYVSSPDTYGGIVELMCHPGHPDYQKEYDMVKDKVVFTNPGIRLISYLDL